MSFLEKSIVVSFLSKTAQPDTQLHVSQANTTLQNAYNEPADIHMTGLVEWRYSAPGELVHFRTDTHSAGNMSCNRWTERQLITYLKNWQQCLQAKRLLSKCHCGHSLWNAATTVLTTLQTSVQLPPSPFFSCLCLKNKHDLGLWCFCADIGLFLFSFASSGVKESDKTESVKENRYCQTDTLSVRRYYWKKPPKKPNSSDVLQWMSALPPAKLPSLCRLCPTLCWLLAAKQR